jgi:hypothetical protein
MKKLIAILICFLASQNLSAQSLSGNMNTVLEGEKVVMKYGNVDIYQNEKLIKTVLTDELGNFSVVLDTGKYVCVLNYDGYAPVRKEITIKGDEMEDFKVAESVIGSSKLKKERAKALRYEESKASLSSAPRHMSMDAEEGTGSRAPVTMSSYSSMKDKYADFVSGKGSVGSGSLTAGEVNDFAKWDLWNTYTQNQFATVAYSWKLLPKGRYTVQIQNRDGLPIADARVNLFQAGKSIFKARTDNTGKAELWASLKSSAPALTAKLSLEIETGGKKEKIDRIKNFENGINHATIRIDCDQSQVVDIAFVFDATGSMGDELRFLQNEIKQIIFDSKKVDDRLNFRFANVFYRDVKDAYVTKQMPFTRILTEANSYIDEQSAGGGGDTPEAVEAALDEALNNLEWSETARARMLFLMLDAPPHNTPETQEKMEKLIRLAAEKGVRIIPIGASGMQKDTEYLMRMLALGTNGTYTFLTNHSGIGGSHIAPTTDSYEVETLNTLMVRLIKSYTFMPDCQSQMPDSDLPYPDSVVQYPFVNTYQDTLKDSTILDTVRFDPSDTNDVINIQWKYYPNPTRGIVNVLVGRDIDALYITDIMGKEIMVIKNILKDRPTPFDLSMYPKGIYLIRYPIGDHWITGKIVLEK